MIDHYYNDAVMSGLSLDRHKESETVELFGQILISAGEEYLEGAAEPPFSPNWARVTSALPEVYDLIKDAALADNV